MSQRRPRPDERSKFIDDEDPPRPEHNADITRRFKLTWRHPGETKNFTESYDERTNDPEQWCRDILKFFNGSLRPGEQPRHFVSCEVEGEVPPEKHNWSKLTAMTQNNPRGGMPFDKMKCERCGITGKRFGLASNVCIDSKFRLKVFKRCDTASAHLKAARERSDAVE